VKAYLSLTKFGIVLFVLLTGLAGYCVSFPLGHPLEWAEPLLFLLGLYFVSSGSFAINQAQEWRIDQAMPRTQNRPIASGHLRPWQAYVIGILFCVVGLGALYILSPMAGHTGLATVIFYNGLYTLYWKKKWAFGAIPGALPGAMPVVIGYAVNNPQIWSADALYLFVIVIVRTIKKVVFQFCRW
jgi:heme o synthase